MTTAFDCLFPSPHSMSGGAEMKRLRFHDGAPLWMIHLFVHQGLSLLRGQSGLRLHGGRFCVVAMASSFRLLWCGMVFIDSYPSLMDRH